MSSTTIYDAWPYGSQTLVAAPPPPPPARKGAAPTDNTGPSVPADGDECPACGHAALDHANGQIANAGACSVADCSCPAFGAAPDDAGSGGGAPAAKPAPPAAAASRPGVELAGPGPSPFPQKAPAPAAGAPVGKPAAPVPGDIPNAASCSNCDHPGSLHADTGDGDNTGACSAIGCSCASMNSPRGDDQGDDGGSQPAQPGPGMAAAAEALAGADPIGGLPTGALPTGSPSASPQPGPGVAAPDPGSMAGPAFAIPVSVVEGVQTADGRMVDPGALTWREPPLPLMYKPANEDAHDGAYLVGRCDEVAREGNSISVPAGVFATSDHGPGGGPGALDVAEMVRTGFIRGVSADIGNVVTEIRVTAEDAEGFPDEITEVIVSGEVMGFTICPFPALAGAYITLVDAPEQATPIPQTPTAAQAANGLNLLNVRECRSCRDGAPLTASAGPLAPPAAWFEDPQLETLTRHLTITADGQVFGHIGGWNSCHIGLPGCVTMPRSPSNYAYYRTGAVLCADGSEVDTGVLTVGTGHASESVGVTAAMAAAHYDNTGTAVADVAIGEDAHGVWVAGAIRPDATEEQIRVLRGSAISGDWRGVGRAQELVGTLAVNVPGFPTVRAVAASGKITSLIAAGGRPVDHPGIEATLAAAQSLPPHLMETLLDTTAERLRKRLVASGAVPTVDRLRQRMTAARQAQQ